MMKLLLQEIAQYFQAKLTFEFHVCLFFSNQTFQLLFICSSLIENALSSFDFERKVISEFQPCSLLPFNQV